MPSKSVCKYKQQTFHCAQLGTKIQTGDRVGWWGVGRGGVCLECTSHNGYDWLRHAEIVQISVIYSYSRFTLHQGWSKGTKRGLKQTTLINSAVILNRDSWTVTYTTMKREQQNPSSWLPSQKVGVLLCYCYTVTNTSSLSHMLIWGKAGGDGAIQAHFLLFAKVYLVIKWSSSNPKCILVKIISILEFTSKWNV